tara:strand:- start:10668 stop:11507 length:840 start_codon:yes stop_codon:yes gene_type:complete
MKKCIVIISGLHRNCHLTVGNFFEKIIEPNMKNYKFDIIICSDYNKENSPKWGKLPKYSGKSAEYHCKLFDKRKYKTEDEFKEHLKKIYNKHNQVKNIIIYNWKQGINPRPTSWFEHNDIGNAFLVCGIHRIKLCVESCDIDIYDRYIWLRPDILIEKEIKLDYYNNKMSMMSFHNNDLLDGMWVGDKALLYWICSFIEINNKTKILDKFKEFKKLHLKDSKLNKFILQIFPNIKYWGVNYENMNKCCKSRISSLYFLKQNNFNFILSSYYNNYIKILR